MEEVTNILFAEQCVPATECPTYQEKWARLGQAAFYDGQTWLVIWKTIFNKSAARYTERQSLETLDYRTAGVDYSELLYNIIYFITERNCESGEKEDKVCCSKDDSEVGRLCSEHQIIKK